MLLINVSQGVPQEINDDFKLYLITDDFIFYMDPNESDDNACTKLFDRNMVLLSDNCFATNELMETMEKIKNNETTILYASEDFLYNYSQ